MNTASKVTATGVAALAAAATLGVATTPAEPTAHGAALKACQTANLKFRKGASQGAAGSELLRIIVINRGPRCKTYGYPGVTLLGRHSKRIRAKVRRLDKPHHVRLAHGAKGHFVLQFPDAPPPGGSCRAVKGARIIAPDDTQRKTIKIKRGGRICGAHAKRKRIYEYPIRRGTKGL